MVILSRLIGVAGGAVAIASVHLFTKEPKVHAAEDLQGAPSFDNVKKWDHSWDLNIAQESFARSKYIDYYENLLSSNVINRSGKRSRYIILVRHGQYVYDEDDANCHLTPLGREQARLAGLRLKQLGYKFDRVINSGMTRAKETADILVAELDPQPLCRVEDPLLNEGDPYHVEPLPKHMADYPTSNSMDRDHPRINEAFRKYIFRANATQDHSTYDLIVCHANVIRYLACKALQFPPEGWLRITLAHSSITAIHIRPDGRVGIRSLGDHGFLPKEKISF